MTRTATIILNRNLPRETDLLFEHVAAYDNDTTDIFVLEAGSNPNMLSKYCTWYADDEESKRVGLRYCRGMNYALLKLYKSGKWKEYDAFFLLTNDTELCNTETVKPLLSILDEHKRVGILSPCSKRWGERFLLSDTPTKYFWFIHNHALLLRRQFLESILEEKTPNYMNFIFDGNNFRGYLSESELIAKAYANDWAAAITSNVFAEENESYLLERSELIRTEDFQENFRLYIEEGKYWLRSKYGFNSRWSMQQYTKLFYDKFFDFHPEFLPFKV